MTATEACATPAPGSRYPSDLARDVTLRDGARVHLRPIRPDDQDRLISFHDRLSEHTAYQRFFDEGGRQLNRAARQARSEVARAVPGANEDLATLSDLGLSCPGTSLALEEFYRRPRPVRRLFSSPTSRARRACSGRSARAMHTHSSSTAN